MGKKKSKSGRKPIAAKDKIVQAWYYIQKKHLDSVGRKRAKEIAHAAVMAESIVR